MADTCTSKDKSRKENEEEYHTDLDAISVTVFDEENVVRLYPEAPTPEIAEKGQCAVVSKKFTPARYDYHGIPCTRDVSQDQAYSAGCR